MQKSLVKLSWLLAMVLCLFARASSAIESHSWQFSLPVGVVSSSNDLHRSKFHVLTGVGVDFWQWRFSNWFLGPGAGVYTAIPGASGNSSVSIKPYLLYGELRFKGAYGLFGDIFSILPFVDVRTQLGTTLISKKVSEQKNLEPYALYALGFSTGLSYFVKYVGFSLSYGWLWGREPVRHELSLSILVNTGQF